MISKRSLAYLVSILTVYKREIRTSLKRFSMKVRIYIRQMAER